MIYLFYLLHFVVCLFLIVVVLLQSGKAADLAGAFGGMGSQTAFGPRGAATVLSKATTIAAILFMVTSLSLAIMTTREGRGSSVLQQQEKSRPATQQNKSAQPAPVQPAPAQGVAPQAPAPPPAGVIQDKGQTVQVPIAPPAGQQPATQPKQK